LPFCDFFSIFLQERALYVSRSLIQSQTAGGPKTLSTRRSEEEKWNFDLNLPVCDFVSFFGKRGRFMSGKLISITFWKCNFTFCEKNRHTDSYYKFNNFDLFFNTVYPLAFLKKIKVANNHHQIRWKTWFK
jgi:hypothetical protein